MRELELESSVGTLEWKPHFSHFQNGQNLELQQNFLTSSSLTFSAAMSFLLRGQYMVLFLH